MLMMPFVLHHYDMSPFSEKIRAMLGYAAMPWCGVQVSEKPPRPLLAPLVSGYRRIPVAQVGADIYCDSQVIADEIALRCELPELKPIGDSLAMMELMAYADGPIFIAAIMNAGGLPLLRKVVRNSGVRQLFGVLSDRAQMAFTAKVAALSPRQAKQKMTAHLDDLEQRLQGHDFLFGDSPVVADFSCYHSLWFLAEMAEKPVLKGQHNLQRWFAEMQGFAAAASTRMTTWRGEQALGLALRSAAAPLPEGLDHEALGAKVSVRPADYGRDAATGVLLAVTDDRFILGHASSTTGEVHIHLPRRGYILASDSSR